MSDESEHDAPARYGVVYLVALLVCVYVLGLVVGEWNGRNELMLDLERAEKARSGTANLNSVEEIRARNSDEGNDR